MAIVEDTRLFGSEGTRFSIEDETTFEKEIAEFGVIFAVEGGRRFDISLFWRKRLSWRTIQGLKGRQNVQDVGLVVGPDCWVNSRGSRRYNRSRWGSGGRRNGSVEDEVDKSECVKEARPI